MSLRLLDTDIMIDVQREFPPAIEWLESLVEPPGLPGLVVMEMMQGCRDKAEMTRLRKRLAPFRFYWPSVEDGYRALTTFAQFNTKHYGAIRSLRLEQPYTRTRSSPGIRKGEE